jgi:hypothetical protein
LSDPSANHEQGFLSDLSFGKYKNSSEIIWKSRKIASGKWPNARYEHASFQWKSKIFIMFGAGEEGPLDDIWSFDWDAEKSTDDLEGRT